MRYCPLGSHQCHYTECGMYLDLTQIGDKEGDGCAYVVQAQESIKQTKVLHGIYEILSALNDNIVKGITINNTY